MTVPFLWMTKGITYTNTILVIWTLNSIISPTHTEVTIQQVRKKGMISDTETMEWATINYYPYQYILLNRYMLNSWWIQMINWVGNLTTHLTHAINLWIK